jgi:predicted RNase H-like nuclease
VPPQLPYTTVAGAVPCARGWLTIPGRFQSVALAAEEPEIHGALADVLDRRPTFADIALHVPIGLADAPSGGSRPCDDAAREALGWPRRVAVDPVPCRAALLAPSFADAQAIEPWLTRRMWRRLHWAREAVHEVQPYHQRRVYSGHPELTFRLLNSDLPLHTSPFWDEGVQERLALVTSRVPGIEVHVKDPPDGVTPLQVLGAAAMLWTARRVAGRVVHRLPDDATWDAAGMRTELVR